MRALVLVTAVLGALAAPASAQESHLNVFLFEKSYAAMGTPSVVGSPAYYGAVAEPAVLAEAQFAIHLPFLRQVGFQKFLDGEGRGFNVFLTPQMRLRALNIPSSPIRSMSFMPKFTLQHLWVLGGNEFGDPGTRHVWGTSFVFGHHSNGGATCEFVDQVEVPDEGCLIPGTPEPDPDPEDREVRVNGGNFSTNYVEIGGGYRIGLTSGPGTNRWKRLVEVAVAFQHHHNWFGFPLPGGPDEDFGALYGLDRGRIEMNGHLLMSNKFALRGSARLDVWNADAQRYPGASNHTLESELFIQFVDDLGDKRWYLPGIMGIGIRYVHGMDHYNTQYVRDVSHFQIALTIDPWSPRIN